MTSSAKTKSLTESLLNLPKTSQSYQRATKHPFLKNAGSLKLSKESLERWLTQDRFYALIGYSNFLGTLISKIPSQIVPHSSLESKIHRNRLTVLAGAMANIDREVGFFENVAEENGLNLSTKPLPNQAQKEVLKGEQSSEVDDSIVDLGLLNSITRGYIDFMVSVASRGTFEEGLVLLWAMEKMYLDAWTYASTFLSQTNIAKEQLEQSGNPRALTKLIDNWSSKEFQKFVKDIGDLVDELDVDINSEMGKRLQHVWITTLWYEERFWQAGLPLN